MELVELWVSGQGNETRCQYMSEGYGRLQKSRGLFKQANVAEISDNKKEAVYLRLVWASPRLACSASRLARAAASSSRSFESSADVPCASASSPAMLSHSPAMHVI